MPPADTAWFTPESTGTYYVAISDPFADPGLTYSVSAFTEPNDHTDNTTTSGIVTVGGAATNGTLGVPGEVDWLAVSLSANQAYEFTISGLTDFAQIELGAAVDLQYGGGALVNALNPYLGVSAATLATDNIWFTPEQTGTYYVE